MIDKSNSANDPLRVKAEQFVINDAGIASIAPRVDVQALVHELQVHQVQLEMQNEELRRAQMELAESRDRYVELYDFAPVGYITVDSNDLILEANLTAGMMLGLERGKLITKRKFSDFVQRDAQDTWYMHRRSVFKSEGKQTCKLSLKKEDGTNFCGRLVSNYMGEKDGIPARCMIGILDITRQEAAEEALRKSHRKLERRVDDRTFALHDTMEKLEESQESLKTSEARYRKLVESANSVILCRRVDGTITFLNRFGLQFFGYREEEIIGRNIIGTLVPPTSSHGRDLAAMIRDIGRHPEDYTVNENENMHKNGQRFWLAWTNRPIRNEQGDVEEIFSIGTDQTEHRQTEMALAESVEKFRTLAEESSNMIFITQEGKVVYANRCCEKVLGYPPEECYAEDFDLLTLYTPKSAKMIESLYFDPWADMEIEPCGVTVRTKKGKTLEVFLATRSVNYNDRPAILSILTDITPLKRVQKRLEMQQKRLRMLALELTRAREEERRCVAAGLHDEIGQLLAASVHRLELFKKSKAPEEISSLSEELIHLLRHAGDQLRALVFDLSSKTLYDVGVVEAIEELCVYMEKRFGIPITVVKEISGSGTQTKDRRAVLYQAVRELLFNIFKHAQAQRAWVRIIETKADTRIEVRDDGKGFDSSGTLRAMTRKGGFGLFQIREQMKAVGGDLFVTSKPGEGTSIAIEVPKKEGRRAK
ncbi:MAG: PAS domain S-box protein [Planctomycetota bacterium]